MPSAGSKHLALLPERLSIELTNRCGKRCSFCYNASSPAGHTWWRAGELVSFVRDCAAHGTRAVSFGGGEPLEYDDWTSVLRETRDVVFRSLTTNGLPLRDKASFADMVRARPDKVHVSIHFPDNAAEVDRVIEQVRCLRSAGIRAGVNLLVRRSELQAANETAGRLRSDGIGNDAIVYLPVRGDVDETPTPREMLKVAGGEKFQSMTCLTACGPSPRFASIGWDGRVGWCSYTTARRPLVTLTAAGLATALAGLGLTFCGVPDDAPQLVQLATA